MIPSVVLAWGPVASYKSTFAASYPKIAWHSFDVGGFERARLPAGVSIIPYVYPAPVKLSMERKRHELEGWVELWSLFLKNLSADLKNPEVETIVIDTMTRCWLACHRAYLQDAQSRNPSKEGLLQIEYGEVNPWMYAIMDAPKQAKKHLVLTAHDEEERQDVVAKGEKESIIVMDHGKPVMKPQGFRHAIKNADLVLHMVPDEDGTPIAVVDKAGLGSGKLRGARIKNPSYAKLEEVITKAEELDLAGWDIPKEWA